MNDRPPRVYMPWTQEEDEKLLKAFREGRKPDQLAEDHQRSLGAIKSRLLHLGLIVPAARR